MSVALDRDTGRQRGQRVASSKVEDGILRDRAHHSNVSTPSSSELQALRYTLLVLYINVSRAQA